MATQNAALVALCLILMMRRCHPQRQIRPNPTHWILLKSAISRMITDGFCFNIPKVSLIVYGPQSKAQAMCSTYDGWPTLQIVMQELSSAPVDESHLA